MASYIPPLGGTIITGPVADWDNPDGYWSEEFGTELDRARAERRPVTCPVCGEPNSAVSVDAINAQRDAPGRFTEFAGRVGSLIKLEDCGHTVKR